MKYREVKEYYIEYIKDYYLEEENKEAFIDYIMDQSKIRIEKEIVSDLDDMLILFFDMKEDGYYYIEEKDDLYIENNILTFVKYEICNRFKSIEGSDKVDIYNILSEFM